MDYIPKKDWKSGEPLMHTDMNRIEAGIEESFTASVGLQGEQGIQGSQGEQGLQGPKGDKGDKGDQEYKDYRDREERMVLYHHQWQPQYRAHPHLAQCHRIVVTQ